MHLYRACRAIVVLVAALLTSGCYVYANAPPAAENIVDHRLAGSWSMLGNDGKPSGVFLHFVMSRNGGPMRMVSTETTAHGVFEFYSVQAGDSQVFAIRQLSGDYSGGTTMRVDTSKFLLGTYRIENENTLLVRTYDARKLAAAVAARIIRGRVAGNAPSVLLTGTPEDVSRMLASPEAQAAISREPFPVARRVVMQ